jgi:hypothetical protein
MSREALIDLLKTIFNLLVHYPRMEHKEKAVDVKSDKNIVMGEAWDDKLLP